MRIQLSDHFHYRKLLAFTLPSIAMMVFTSIYSLVDGFFVSNFVGKTAFSAINLIGPVFSIVGSLGMMIGAGGTAIVGRTLGEKEPEKANQYFSMLIFTVLMIGTITAIIGWFITEPLAVMLGAEGQMLEDCIVYGRISFLGSPFFMLQFSMQTFFITAEKPRLGLAVTVLGGVSNMILDALLIAVFPLGVLGAAVATTLAQVIATLFALIYFAFPNNSLLHLTFKTRIYGRVLGSACVNGSSEMVGNIAYSIVTILYNTLLLRYYGEDGVAAYGVLMYVGFIFSAIYYGYSMGVAPVISYNYGAANHKEMKNLFRKSMVLITLFGITMLAISQLATPLLSKIFVGYDKELYELTCHAMRIYSISFLVMGVAAFGSSFYTALNNGVISAVISFVRTFVFEIGAVLLLPFVFGEEAIWWAVVVSGVASTLLTVIFFVAYRKKYQYA